MAAECRMKAAEKPNRKLRTSDAPTSGKASPGGEYCRPAMELLQLILVNLTALITDNPLPKVGNITRILTSRPLEKAGFSSGGLR